MQLIVLTENCAGSGFLAEHGLSYLIKAGGKTILFDTGHTNVYKENAALMGIDLQEEVDFVVLSHGHWDHSGGLRFLKDLPLVAHPLSFMVRSRKSDGSHIAISQTKEELESRYNLILSQKPYYMTDSILFLGEIPRLNDFEAQTTPFVDKEGHPDFVLDDSALVVIENNELHIIAGCSHSGICNIINYAKKVTGVDKINTVVGGLHLKHYNKQTQQTVSFLKAEKPENVYPSHCTALPAIVAFGEAFEIEQLKTGMSIDL